MSVFVGNCKAVSEIINILQTDVLFGGIVCPFPFQSVRVSNIILVHFIERVVIDPVERLPPEYDSFFHRQTQNLVIIRVGTACEWLNLPSRTGRIAVVRNDSDGGPSSTFGVNSAYT